MPQRRATEGARLGADRDARHATRPSAGGAAAPGLPPKGQPDSRADVDPDVADLLGLRPVDAADLPDASELDDGGVITDTRIYEGELEARAIDSDQPDEERLESLLATEARAGETDDAFEASDEGLAWIPPTDPPVRPGDDGNPEIAAGFGTSSEDEPFDADHHGELLFGADERAARVEEALRADAETSLLTDRLTVDVDGGRVVIEGVVDDLDDEDAVVAVAEEVPGVSEVISRIVVAALETETPEAETEKAQGGQR